MSTIEISHVYQDCGQGSCHYIKSGKNAFIIDSGESTNASKLLESIERNGVQNATFEVSHFDGDHVGGLIKIFKNYSNDFGQNLNISSIYFPDKGGENNSSNYYSLVAAVYRWEAISATADILSMDEKSYESLNKALNKGSKSPDDTLWNKYLPVNEKERLALRYLLKVHNNKATDFVLKELKEKYFNNNESDTFECIAKYAEKLCELENTKFKKIELIPITVNEIRKDEIHDIGTAIICKCGNGNSLKEDENKNSLSSLLMTKFIPSMHADFGDYPDEKEPLSMLQSTIEDIDNLRVCTLSATHHAGENTTQKGTVETLEPKFIIVQAIKEAYGHPTDEFMVNTKRWGVPVLLQQYCHEIVVTERYDTETKEHTSRISIETIKLNLKGMNFVNGTLNDECSLLEHIRRLERKIVKDNARRNVDDQDTMSKIDYLIMRHNEPNIEGKGREVVPELSDNNNIEKFIKNLPSCFTSRERDELTELMILSNYVVDVMDNGFDIDDKILGLLIENGKPIKFKDMDEMLDVFREARFRPNEYSR